MKNDRDFLMQAETATLDETDTFRSANPKEAAKAKKAEKVQARKAARAEKAKVKNAAKAAKKDRATNHSANKENPETEESENTAQAVITSESVQISPLCGDKKRTPHEKYLLSLKRNKIKIFTLQIAILVGFFGLWELLTAVGLLDSFIFSSPSRVIKMLGGMKDGLFRHVGITLYECVLSFAVSTAAGVFIAFCLWWSDTARRVLEPYIVVLNSLPKIALGPIIIVWVGVGTRSIVMMSIMICIVVTIISVLNGFMSCDSGKILLLRSMGAGKMLIFFKLVLPNSVPDLLSVLKVNVGLAWVGTIMGEYLVSGAGLGYLIIYGGQVFKLDLVMMATLLLCLLATGMYLLVALLEKRLNRHRVV